MEKMKDLLLIGAIMGALSLIIRGVNSIKTAIIEWVTSVVVAVLLGWAIRDYIISDNLYNACVATGSFFGIYIVRGAKSVMQGFSKDPISTIKKIRGK